MSAIVVEQGWVERRNIDIVCKRMDEGIGLTRDGGGSCLL